ncbi:MAG: helix-turn-helix transcriptional regulator [Oscillospiraceae bacterium]|nr:helix-turn-helix transcriptional regulator [Oscillospiraceae bacterium]
MFNFAEHLKLIRKSKGLTQSKVARGIDISERIYQGYESGEGKPSFDNIIALADFFDITTDYLLGREDLKNG